MTLEIVEIALDRFTDWAAFEPLAAEIMRDEGYPDIRPLGGMSDDGQDAVVERFYLFEGRRARTVFQFTLRQDVLAKVDETIKRLDEKKVEFQKLIIVTRAEISTERQQTAKKKVLSSHGVDLEIIERKTLSNRLSNFENGIFYRYFPDIKQQVENLFRSSAADIPDVAKRKEMTLLKICCAFAFAPETHRARRALFDQAVLAGLFLLGAESATAEKVLTSVEEALGKGILADVQQVSASLSRLTNQGSVKERNGEFALSDEERLRIEGAWSAMKAGQESTIEDIVDEVCNAAGRQVSEEEQGKLVGNAQKLLLEYFRTLGLEFANTFLSEEVPRLVYKEQLPHLLLAAGRGLSADLGQLLCDAFAHAIASPTETQARYFARCARAYIAMQAMNLDPALREFQGTRLRTKAFALDTDFVLEAMIYELPLSATYRDLVAKLVAAGTTVIVPESVLEEVVTHLDISVRTYDYFGLSLGCISEGLLEPRVKNVLVRGFWYHCQHRECDRSVFMRYRANYYAEEDRQAFVRNVLEEALPGAQVVGIKEFFEIHDGDGDLERIREVMLEFAQNAARREHRTDAQTQELAEHDALFMWSIVQANRAGGERPRTILGGRAYIITTSGRYVRAAERMNLKGKPSARPQTLLGLLEMVGGATITDRQMVALMENSLLQLAVDACWPAVQLLLEAGLDLSDKSITRLRHDSATKFDRCITSLREVDAADEEAVYRRHLDLAREAPELGYRLSPMLARVRELGEVKEQQFKKIMEENTELREAIRQFGKRKERWLRRFDRNRKQN